MKRYALLVLFAVGCTADPLYAYCATGHDCRGRTADGSDAGGAPAARLECVEVTVDVRADLQTRGAFCTLPCTRDADCRSHAGLADGACVRWAGDERHYCYQRCSAAAPCYPSSSCEAVVLDGVPMDLCLPERR